MAKMSDKTTTVPAPSLDLLLCSLFHFCLPKQVCEAARKYINSQKIECRFQQIVYVSPISYPISIHTLAKVFDDPKSHVKSALEHEMEPPEYRGKHTKFGRARERQILEWIQENAESKAQIEDCCR
jgi:hypothetical protein